MWYKGFIGGSAYQPRLTGLECPTFFVNNSKTIKDIWLIFFRSYGDT